MKKLFTFLISAALALPLSASFILPATVDDSRHAVNNGELVTIQELQSYQLPRLSTRSSSDDIEYTEWETYGTVHFPEEFLNDYNVRMSEWAIDAPEWYDDAVNVSIRHSVDNDRIGQIRFVGLCGLDTEFVFNLDNGFFGNSLLHDTFNNRDEEGYWVPTYLDTGILNTVGSNYDTFKIMLYGAWINLDAGMIGIPQFWMMVSDNSGFPFYNIGNMVVDGYNPVTMKIDCSNYISSTDEAKLEVKVDGPDEIAMCRVAIGSFYYEDVARLTFKDPVEEAPVYTDYAVSNSLFTIKFEDVDTPTHYSLLILPFNADGKCLGNYVTRSVNINRENSHTWESIGKGMISEIISYYGMDSSLYDSENQDALTSPFTYEVEIEEASDAPGLYRIVNPFGENHPQYSNFTMTNPGENFYIYIDATNPSEVAIPLTYTGFNDYSSEAPVYIKLDPGYWCACCCKLIDKSISFPGKSLLGYHSIDICNTSFSIDVNNEYDIFVELPGYIPYPVSWETEDFDEDNNIVLNVSDRIASVDCAFVPEKEYSKYRYYPEVIWSKISENTGEYGVKTYTVKDGKVTINAEELKALISYDSYYLVAVQRDYEGVSHKGITGPHYNYLEWVDLGTATIVDKFILYPWGYYTDVYTGTCKVMQSTILPGLYKLVDAYKSIAESIGFINYVSQDLFIDATDPERVTFVTDNTGTLPPYYGVPTGFTYIYMRGQHYINTYGNYCEATGNETSDNYYGKFDGNVIYFSGDALVFSLLESSYYDEFSFTGSDMELRVTLPTSGETSGVNVNVSEDVSESPVEYFNLQGVKIANPSNGIYIRRQGNKTDKVYIK